MKESAKSPAQSAAVSVQDFLNPTSMLTPGLAGAMTMMISNALSFQFGLPPSWTGLGVSFLMGMLVWSATKISFVPRAVYYVLNSLVIFCVAAGSGGVAASASERIASLDFEIEVRQDLTFQNFLGIARNKEADIFWLGLV